VRRRAAAGVAEVAKIGTQGTGSSAVWPGSESERRGTHLGVRWSRGRRTGARGGEEWNGGDGELQRAEQRERGGEKGLETLLTTTRSSGVAWPTRIGDGTADRRRDAELREAPTMARRRLGFERGKRRRLGEAKGVVRALFIGPVGDPWRAGQGAARGGVWRPDSLSPRRPRGGRRPRQAGPACRRQRGGGADLGRKRKVGWWKGGVWAAGEEKRKGEGGGLGRLG